MSTIPRELGIVQQGPPGHPGIIPAADGPLAPEGLRALSPADQVHRVMSTELILPLDFGEYENEVEMKGYFVARIKRGELLVGVTFYDPTRLFQEVLVSLEARPAHPLMRSMVIDRVTKGCMLAAVDHLPDSFFEA